MIDHSPLRVSPSTVLRTSALPATSSTPTLGGVDLDDPAAVTAYVRAVTGDPFVREAIAVSSQSLTHTLDAIDAGCPVETKKLRRAALAVTRYLLRMTTRPTPFGLMAGVSVARFGDTTAVRVGDGHRKGVRADAGWLAGVVRARLRDLDVVRPLQVVLNNLCTVRGDRLVLGYAPVAMESEQAPRELSVRHTPLLAAVAAAARRPVVFAALVERLCAEFPAAGPEAVERLLLQLVERQVLLTELAPPPSAADPVDHVLARLPGDPELLQARAAIRRYAEAPLGAGLPAWRDAVRGEAGSRHAPHVDLAADVAVTMHRRVAAELEHAQAALVRLTPADVMPPHLYRYHLDFLVKYGDTQVVPVLELLDAATGMDAPAGYRVPRSTRETQVDPRSRRSVERDRLRGALAQQAVLDGTGEVELDDALLDRLAVDDDVAPPEFEVGVEVVAASAAAIDDGDFRLVLWSTLMGLEAGALSGRFAHLLGDLGADGGPGGDVAGFLPAQLEFMPAFVRSANLARVPRLLRHRLPIGIFADPDDPAAIDIGDLAVGGDSRGLYLWSVRHGAEVVPSMLHRLDPWTQAPNVVRFLLDVVATRRRGLHPWDWGPAGDKLPYLSRVRRGRTVLAPASWRTDPLLADRTLSRDAWDDRFAAWRALWRVPRSVSLAVADARVGLDLDAPMHRALLRHEIERQPESFLIERLGDGAGWLGGHAHELVVTMRSAQPEARAAAPRVRPAPTRHLPGGEWTYAKLYAPEDLHRRLIAHSLDVLRSRLPSLVDRWFFVRYADPLPHLRIRVHGGAGEVLPLVRDWARELCEAGMAQRLALDTYEPEVSRYGGPKLLEAAERAFHADSEAVIAQLRLAPAPRMPSELLVAANVADIAASFGDPGWREWLLTAVRKNEHHAAFRAVRRDAVAAIADGAVDPRLPPIWAARGPAVRAYGDAVRANGAGSPLGSLLHMHQIRLAGISPAAEARAYAIARGAVQALLDREEHVR